MVVGIAGSGGRSLGRVGTKALVYFFSVTGVAIVFGLLVGNIFQPGVGADFSSAVTSTVQALCRLLPKG